MTNGTRKLTGALLLSSLFVVGGAQAGTTLYPAMTSCERISGPSLNYAHSTLENPNSSPVGLLCQLVRTQGGLPIPIVSVRVFDPSSSDDVVCDVREVTTLAGGGQTIAKGTRGETTGFSSNWQNVVSFPPSPNPGINTSSVMYCSIPPGGKIAGYALSQP